eukprot:CAMPEP_0115690956 /NCGR_PEP_ID=MMETSP0272-20121206/62395_1 /TAXON_ID=71861 /ORGANISM="Scrippsiella trochoidea, Strain CCMP3099" /LENGTH=127 /DNA_ID=CAMNT_0003130895 /DNA_START=48 /DNA_END=428 /DNA_ORIENTATION=-
MPDPATEWILFTGFLCMAASTFTYEFMPGAETRRFNYVAMAMTGFCSCGYLAMYCGAGRIVVDGHDVFWMRYLDWLCATEFFLFGLCMHAVVFAAYNVTLFGPMQASATKFGDAVANKYKRITTFSM